MVKTREKWVDDVKVIACILVVLGHFFQSMTKANILPENNLYGWFNTTIYYFHVPLFFICSGYLYQKYSRVNSVGSWRRNVVKKILALGVPYVTFSTATWVLKKAFSSSVNNQIGGLGDTLLFHPASPYWYLYALFFIFLLTSTFKSVKIAVGGLIVATAMKTIALNGGGERRFGRGMDFIAKYTMPIFLMHTLFAAPMRSVLLKLGIGSSVIHVVLGLGISFGGPIIAAWIMKKTKWLEFFLYPNKLIKKQKGKKKA